MSCTKQISLLGASAYTGKLIAELLHENGIDFTIAGRDIAKLKELQENYSSIQDVFIVNIESDNDISKLIKQTDILINCVGPFNLFGKKVLEQSVEAGICYLDISGEQAFVNNSFNHLSEKAIGQKASVFHSLAFESALADLMAKIYLPSIPEWKEISSLYAFKNIYPSPGTRLSMLTSSFFPAVYLVNSKLNPSESLFTRAVKYPSHPELNAALFAAYPDLIFFNRQFKVKNSASYILTRDIEAKYLSSSKANKLSLDEILSRHNKRKKAGPKPEERARHEFEIIIYAEDTQGQSWSINMTGFDSYGLTASIITNYVKQILFLGSLPYGIMCPSEISSASVILERLVKENNLKIDQNLDFAFEVV